MEKILIKHLEMVADEVSKEAKEKKEWGNFGNYFGQSETKKKLEFWAEILMAIAANISPTPHPT